MDQEYHRLAILIADSEGNVLYRTDQLLPAHIYYKSTALGFAMSESFFFLNVLFVFYDLQAVRTAGKFSAAPEEFSHRSLDTGTRLEKEAGSDSYYTPSCTISYLFHY